MATVLSSGGTTNITTSAQLNDVIAQADQATAGAYQINLGSNIDLTGELNAINLQSGVALDIEGGTHALDGGGSWRGFFVYSGVVSINDLTIQNTLARGGDGTNGSGGGAGLGGGLFVANDSAHGAMIARVQLGNVTFSNNRAVGGGGGVAGGTGGGGGMGGDGGNADAGNGGGGGGGLGVSAQGGVAPGGGGTGILTSGAAAGAGGSFVTLWPQEGAPDLQTTYSGGAGGASGGGGGGAGIDNGDDNSYPPFFTAAGGGGGVGGETPDRSFISEVTKTPATGGAGGFGGGGGGGAYFPIFGSAAGGAGGFGGGGGSGLFNGGNGGFGGGGGQEGGVGGFGGGNGITDTSGGGGLGAGGAIFVQAGSSLTIGGRSSVTPGTVAGGASSGQAGRAYGDGIFLQGGSASAPTIVTLQAPAGSTQVNAVSGVIADEAGSSDLNGGSGVGAVVIAGTDVGSTSGAGTVKFSAINTYTGGTSILSGAALEIGAQGTAGTGSIFFSNTGGSLKIDAAPRNGSVFVNMLNGFNSTNTIDLAGLIYGDGASASVVNNVLEVTSGATTQDFILSNPATGTLMTADDGSGGTLVSYAPLSGAAPSSSQNPDTAAPSGSTNIELGWQNPSDPGGILYGVSADDLSGTSFERRRSDKVSTGRASPSSPQGADAWLSGTLTNPADVTNVEVFAGDTDLGAATVASSGTWTFQLDKPGAHRDLNVLVTTQEGQIERSDADFDLITGIKNRPFTAVQNQYNSTTNDLEGQTFFNADGSMYKHTAIFSDDDGSRRIVASGGTALAGQNEYALVDYFNANGIKTREDQHNIDGTHTIDGLVAGQTLSAIANDVITGTGGGNTYRFTPSFGSDTITNFITEGRNHDVLSFTKSDFSSLSDILAHTTDVGGNAVITGPAAGDTVTLLGVSRAELATHRRDFSLT